MLAGVVWLAVPTADAPALAPTIFAPEPEPAVVPVAPEPAPPAPLAVTPPKPLPAPPTSPTVAPPRTRPTPARAAHGRLLVNLVPWAEASVDGRTLGRTPLTVELAPGKHTLELQNPDLGQRRTRAITITRGADTHVTDW
ncbi:PEGA domain-containing protein [Nannocystis pusilla]|uniref:PEGA domain-containing protein n=1 Tax=Nannocystis pusilla TaxID=889268 RepID=UPI003B787BFC